MSDTEYDPTPALPCEGGPLDGTRWSCFTPGVAVFASDTRSAVHIYRAEHTHAGERLIYRGLRPIAEAGGLFPWPLLPPPAFDDRVPDISRPSFLRRLRAAWRAFRAPPSNA